MAAPDETHAMLGPPSSPRSPSTPHTPTQMKSEHRRPPPPKPIPSSSPSPTPTSPLSQPPVSPFVPVGTTITKSARSRSSSTLQSTLSSPPAQPTANPFARPSKSLSSSRKSSAHNLHDSGGGLVHRTSQPLGGGHGMPYRDSSLRFTGMPTRASMVLYRLADDPATSPPSTHTTGASEDDAHGLLPPSSRFRGAASERSSIISFGDDSKYPDRSSFIPLGGGNIRDSTMSFGGKSVLSGGGTGKSARGLVPYAYDPAMDEMADPDEEDLLHDPSSDKVRFKSGGGAFPWRGLANVSVLGVLITGLLMLFVFYPVYLALRDNHRRLAIDGNIRINSTGQAPVLFQLPSLIDPDTPDDVKSRTGFDGDAYTLVFSDEFETEGRTFYPGDDPFWEAPSIWYGVTGDLEWYDPSQVTTQGGSLLITMDSATTSYLAATGVTYDLYNPQTFKPTTEPHLTVGSTAPFTPQENHLMDWRSGMLQSWNKMCFTGGYIEVSVILPGADENAEGYWPGAWTMGNLARPGYSGTTEGMWPYTYDSCDVGTFPNQTNPDKLTPSAAHFSQYSRTKYNQELSWLAGQRLSACTCPNEDHPGPIVDDGSGQRYRGRGAPEIDILEAEKDKDGGAGQVVSQSAQFAPFTRDYDFGNATEAQFKVYDTAQTRLNSYKGSAVQQAVSALTKVPSTDFQGQGKHYTTYGFEYMPNPSSPQDGYITWQVNGAPTARMAGSAMGPDPENQSAPSNIIPDPLGTTGGAILGSTSGTGVGQRLVPEEPMSIVLNLGISPNWQTINTASLLFPAEFRVDYVRVYQKVGHENVGCNPKDYPTSDYINNHLDIYNDANVTIWNYTKPKNRLYDGGC